jgi:hypothetical protein
MAKKFDIVKFNSLLQKHNQQIRAISISSVLIELSNGVLLTTETDIRKCKRRVMNEQPAFITQFDCIYQFDRIIGKECERQARAESSRKGGLSCQQKHGDKISKNLNIGTPWNKGKSLHYDVWHKGLNKHSDHRLMQLSISRMGTGNPMYGKKHTEEYKHSQSVRMKVLIKEGKFTPNSNNQNTHWNSMFDGKSYRSSWEAIYQAHHQTAIYEDLRIEYNHDGNEHIYIVDFVDYDKRMAIEVKPESGFNDQKTKDKISALSQWCNLHKFEMILADRDYLLSLGAPTDLSCFDEKTRNKVKQFYEIE